MCTEKAIRCAIYDRVSTDLQVKEGLSLEAQRQALTDYALSHNYKIVDYYTDEGITARKKMQNRKDLVRLLQDVKADKIDLILVTKLDRWFRNIKDYHNTQAVLEAHHCNWKTIFEEYDTATSNGRFAINIMLSVNENECDRDSERIRSVFEYKKRNREHLNGRPAFGYTTDASKHLIKDPDTKQIVEHIFEHYFTTYSKKDTVRYISDFYREQAPTMYQINSVLSSETYTGRLYGIDAYCEAYITQAQFRKIRDTSDAKLIPHQTEPFLFSSMIQCPVCGKNMSGFVRRRTRKDGTVSEYKRYRCSAKFTQYHGGACLAESTVEEYLFQNILIELDGRISRLNTMSKKKCRPADSPARLREEIERLNSMFQKGRVSEQYYDAQYNELSQKLTAANDEVPSLAAWKPIIDVLSGNWREIYHKLDCAHKKAFWKSLIKEIYVDPDSHKVCGFSFRT